MHNIAFEHLKENTTLQRKQATVITYRFFEDGRKQLKKFSLNLSSKLLQSISVLAICSQRRLFTISVHKYSCSCSQLSWDGRNPLSLSINRQMILLTDLLSFSYSISWESFSNFPLVIILQFILISCSLDCVLILWGEMWCWSLLGLKGLSRTGFVSPNPAEFDNFACI